MATEAKFTVLVTDYDYPELDIEKEIVEEAGGALVAAQCRTEEDVIREARGADGLLNQYAPITRRVIRNLDRCRVVARYGIGVDNIDIPAATEKKVVIVNVPSYCEEEVSTHTLSLILACMRKLTLFTGKVKEGSWDWKPGRPIMRLSEQTLGLIAFGKIARKVARKARVFGFKILGFDPYVPGQDFQTEGVEKVDLKRLLQESDVISIHAPLTEKTRHILGEEEFKMMKNSAFLVNTSRGPVVDQDALFKALRKEEIAGAGLDVLEKEPPEENDPLLKLENVIFTPHAAWYSETSFRELRRSAIEDVVRVIQGKMPRGFVNRQLMNNPSFSLKDGI